MEIDNDADDSAEQLDDATADGLVVLARDALQRATALSRSLAARHPNDVARKLQVGMLVEEAASFMARFENNRPAPVEAAVPVTAVPCLIEAMLWLGQIGWRCCCATAVLRV